MKMYRPLMILVAAMLIFYAVMPAVSAESQTWYFTEAENTTVGAPYANDGWCHHKDLVMNKTKPADGRYSNLYGQRALWFYANTGAQTDLSFGECAWTAKIYTSDPGEKAGNITTVDICKITPDGTVTVIASGSVTLQDNKKEYDVICEDNTSTTQDFSTGDWLGARVSWNGPANATIRIIYDPSYYTQGDKDSYITSPESDPGYPTSPTIEPIPEFTTIAIPIAIVLGLMFLFRRRKQKS